MRTILAAEHFDLTPSIREHAETQLNKVREFVPEDVVVRAFLVKDCHHVFTVLLKAHWRHEDRVVRVSGDDLYALIGQAVTALRRSFQKVKNRRIRKRRAYEGSIENKEESA